MSVNLPGINQNKANQPAADQTPTTQIKPEATQAPSQQQPQAPTSGFTQSQQPKKTIMNPNQPITLASLNAFEDPISNTPHAEAVSLLQETLKRITTGLNDQYVLTIIPVDGQENQLNISSIILALQYGAKGQARTDSGVAFHALLLADTMSQKDRQDVININGQNVAVPRPASDAYDERYKKTISAIMAREFRTIDEKKIFDADAEVIPSGYAYKEDEQVRRTLYNALKALASILNAETNTTAADFTLVQNGAKFTVNTRVNVRQPNSVDSVGNPVRSDVNIEFVEVQAQQGNTPRDQIQSLHGGEQTQHLFTVRGFLDLIWNPENPAIGNQSFAFMAPQNQNQTSRVYQPRFVITGTDAARMPTLPSQLLQLASTLALTYQHAWISQLMPQKSNKLDLHDIGAIGYEVLPLHNQAPDAFKTREETFDQQQLGKLINAFLYPDLWVSMDIEECGPETWSNSVFAAAAQGNGQANKFITAAADYLTGGLFSKIYKGSGQAVVSDQNRIHNGYYHDTNGVKRDIREVDYLAMLNKDGKNDIGNVKGYSDTFLRVEYPLEQRLDARLKYIHRVLGDSVVLTGFSRRVTFENEFLNSLLTAVVQCGLVMRAQTPMQDINVAPRATAAFINQNAALSSQNGFRNSFSNTPQGGFLNNGMTSRWNF